MTHFVLLRLGRSNVRPWTRWPDLALPTLAVHALCGAHLGTRCYRLPLPAPRLRVCFTDVPLATPSTLPRHARTIYLRRAWLYAQQITVPLLAPHAYGAGLHTLPPLPRTHLAYHTTTPAYAHTGRFTGPSDGTFLHLLPLLAWQ